MMDATSCEKNTAPCMVAVRAFMKAIGICHGLANEGGQVTHVSA
jgi:hypothetical protein